MGLGNDNDKKQQQQQQLRDAAESGDYTKVSQLLEAGGVPADTRDHNNWSALHTAAANGHDGIVRILLENGAVPDLKDNGWSESTPLHCAASRGNPDCIELLLSHGGAADIMSRDALGLTPLHDAARAGQEYAIELFLERGVPPNVTDNHGGTPLMSAAGAGKTEAVKALLLEAASGGLETVNFADRNGYTALHRAVDTGAKAGHADVIAALIDKGGADVEKQNSIGETPLLIAAHHGHFCAVATLLSHGADVHYERKYEGTALHVAAKDGHAKICKLLIAYGGASIGAEIPDNKSTPLNEAAKGGQYSTVEFLLNAGADPKVVDAMGRTPLATAERFGAEEGIISLLSRST